MKRKIVCLCGSTRFSDAYRKANLEETLAGNIVLTVGSMTHSDAQLAAIGVITDEQKIALDILHKDKITMADEVLVLNDFRCKGCGSVSKHGHQQAQCPGKFEPYIGESTKSEIAHALALGKPVRFLNDHLIDQTLWNQIRPAVSAVDAPGLTNWLKVKP